MTGNPMFTPRIAGSVRLNPYAAPEAMVMVLLGPGVPAPASTKRIKEKIAVRSTYACHRQFSSSLLKIQVELSTSAALRLPDPARLAIPLQAAPCDK